MALGATDKEPVGLEVTDGDTAMVDRLLADGARLLMLLLGWTEELKKLLGLLTGVTVLEAEGRRLLARVELGTTVLLGATEKEAEGVAVGKMVENKEEEGATVLLAEGWQKSGRTKLLWN